MKLPIKALATKNMRVLLVKSPQDVYSPTELSGILSIATGSIGPVPDFD
jgi:hypothetical protein